MKKKTTSKASPAAAIILAAGKGTRMKSSLPKVMHALAGYPMVAHVAWYATAAKLSPLTLVIAPGMDQVVDAVKPIAAQVKVARQTKQLGTAHAVLAAKSALKGFTGNLLVLYGDTPLLTDSTMKLVLDTLTRDKKCAVAVLGFTPDDPSAYGRLVINHGQLERIVEAREANSIEKNIMLCNSGVMALRGDVAWKLLAQIDNKNSKKEYYLTDIVALARKAGYTARAVEGDPEEVLGVNSRMELAQAEAIFQDRLCREHMHYGVTVLDPLTVYFSADTMIGNDTIIEPNVYFGPGVKIGSGVRIKAFSHIEGTTIADNATVGPFARLRPGTQIAQDARIGNFVEIKKSTIARGAKISHLSYIGDATVGAEANIGAGTITCNYDGYNKHKTVIGREVFIGSNTALVAPVKVGDGAMVAAGSVITENVPADALAVGRARQSQKKAWAKNFRAKQKKKK